MKIYKAYLDGEAVRIGTAEATITAKQIMLDDYYAAWGYTKRFNKSLPLHRSERAALKAFIEDNARTARQLQSQIRKNQDAIKQARDMMETI